MQIDKKMYYQCIYFVTINVKTHLKASKIVEGLNCDCEQPIFTRVYSIIE